ncbi:hypothetical protein [Phyllobacterium chamaecytisi]|uniref:hypothetical protein n=1 Tax=Phyllobacterium chamaecytisi TaxID=2876082 RepID=UPI001CCAC65A|nr:hypothetical protein [Phyllobacterium sp. KW56]MBZ9600766.1 hypothetical protein [Phyllobacterium sp. KW56]
MTIINHDGRGFIYHICSEPGDAETLANLLAMEGALHLPGVPLPFVPVRDVDGKLVIEDGKVKKESPGFTQPEVSHDRHMVVDGAVVLRPTLPSGDVEIKADGIDAYVIDGLPTGSVLRLDGAEIVIDDGTLEFTTDEPGIYVFEASFPFVDWQVKVTAR